MSFRRINRIFVLLLAAAMPITAGLAVRSAYSAEKTDPGSAIIDPGSAGEEDDGLDQGFWQRHESIIESVKIFAGIIVLTYLIKFAIWLIQQVVVYLSGVLGDRRISVKRTGTLLSFGGSIAKLFVWIFGLIAILSVYGITPAAGAGVIGLIGLILAGMFQQIVIDFVKGLDIIAGRHYNVGDFIEVDGKLGHVIDFTAKYTKIRTFSGQEFNIPNSKCVPSRRFPDGYVSNYVDIALKKAGDESGAKNALEPVCIDLNRRVEPVRDVPVVDRQFTGPEGLLILRYRVRVLPGCAWVITDYFIPAVKQALADRGIELAGEPTFFFINRIETFRKLFSRQLTEQEIIRQTVMEQTESAEDDKT